MRKPIPNNDYQNLLDWIEQNLSLGENEKKILINLIDNYGQEKYSDGVDDERFRERDY